MFSVRCDFAVNKTRIIRVNRLGVLSALLLLAHICCFTYKNVAFKIGSVKAWAGDAPVLADRAGGGNPQNHSIARKFLGEELRYGLSFLGLFKPADCVVSFKRGELSGQYEASIWAKTKGIIGWLTNYREYQIISIMEEVENGRRLRPIMFKRMTTVNNIEKRTHRFFDYQEGRIDYSIFIDGRLVSLTCRDVPRGRVYEDILSAFYNFRAGVFGEIKKGQSYRIPTVPKKGIKEYTVEVLDQEKEQDERNNQDWDGKTGYVLRIKVDKEIFGTKEGLLWVLMSEDVVPLGGVAEDAIGLGDIVGTLNKTSPNKFGGLH